MFDQISNPNLYPVTFGAASRVGARTTRRIVQDLFCGKLLEEYGSQKAGKLRTHFDAVGRASILSATTVTTSKRRNWPPENEDVSI